MLKDCETILPHGIRARYQRLDWDTTKLTIPCVKCQQDNEVIVKSEELFHWQRGHKMVQDCFPNLTPAKRELFVTGLCGQCFADLFDDVP